MKKNVDKSNDATARVVLCAASTEDIRHFRHRMPQAAASWDAFLLGQDDPGVLGQTDVLLLLVPQAPAMAGMLLKQLRRQFSLLELPVLLLATHAGEDVSALLAQANDFIVGEWSPEEVQMRLSKLLQMRKQFQETSALNLQLHSDLHDRSAKLNTLIENGLLMSATRDVSALFHHALWEGKRLLHCDACSLYLVTPNKTLRFVMRTKSDTLPANEIQLYHPETGLPNEHYISVYVALHGKSVVIDDVYSESRFDLSGTKAFDQATQYKTVSVLTVPMAARGGAVSGVFQFINRKDPRTDATVAFPASYVPLVEALAAQAAVTYENLQLLDERKRFTESLIQTVATATDARSPHTRRHSQRVPELALMLAQAAHDSDQPPFAGFRFASDDAWHEFRVGAWLHDCGKIATPECVINKATKLEIFYNRIHEVRMRFEVLLRDAQIARMEAVMAGGPAVVEAADHALADRNRQLQDDFAFLAQCNLGSALMDEAAVARIRALAKTQWLQHFDDRLGLGIEELERRSQRGSADLPRARSLLEDAAHHLIERLPDDVPPPEFGFQVEVPQYLYNQGEVHNLSVQKGTLTAEDRYKINEHMIYGIMMLERLPFPDALKRVPEYAGTHHETLSGSGYPRRLDAAALSIPARIMAIADIFEALTASDRPFEQAKKFSEAVDILHSLKQQGHIDPDLFDLFLMSGVHLQFADKFLLPAQRDTVDIQCYLG